MKEQKKNTPKRTVLLCIMAVAALIVTMPLVGCKDYDHDIDSLQEQIDSTKAMATTTTENLQKQIEPLSTQVNDLTTTLETALASTRTEYAEVQNKIIKPVTSKSDGERSSGEEKYVLPRSCTCPTDQ